MRLITLIFLALLPYPSAAQEQAVSMSVINKDIHPMISISNQHTLPIEAFLVTVDRAATGKPLTRIYYDVHSNYKSDVAILPNASKEVPLPRILEEELPVSTLRAVVFSDGSSSGDPDWVRELLHRRKILSDRIEEVMGLLQRIAERNLTREEALDALQAARQARRQATPDATVEERVWHDQIFYLATKNLEPRAGSSRPAPELNVIIKHINQFLRDWDTDLERAQPSLRRHPGPAPVTGAPIVR